MKMIANDDNQRLFIVKPYRDVATYAPHDLQTTNGSYQPTYHISHRNQEARNQSVGIEISQPVTVDMDDLAMHHPTRLTILTKSFSATSCFQGLRGLCII